MARFVASLDMYRKVPGELLEGTRRGSILSLLAVAVMATLFILETRAFLRSKLVTDLSLDSSDERKIRVNFNITMMDLPCEYAVVDVVSPLGTDQNITQHITKFQIDQDGVNKRFHARNKHQHDLALFDETVTETIEELHDDGEDAVPLTPETLQTAIEENQFVFVDFYASWCSHCRQLAPTWETLAEVMDTAAANIVDDKIDKEREELGEDHDWTDEDYEHAVKVELPVLIAKIDCVAHDALCREQSIMAYPTLRLFANGKREGADYSGHRTVVAFTDYLATVEKQYFKDHPDLKPKVSSADEIARQVHKERGGSEDHLNKLRKVMKREWIAQDHPGCQLSGFLMLDRVPGNFHVQARSRSHDLVPHMTNVSHEVHHLSFGEPYVRRKLEQGTADVPRDLLPKTVPMDGNVYVNHRLHEAHHHYLKVVTTSFKDRGMFRKVYQVLEESSLTWLTPDQVPEAQFKYDLSPIAVSYRRTQRKWYDYLTSLMAIIGGTFTVVGMLESGIYVATKKKRF